MAKRWAEEARGGKERADDAAVASARILALAYPDRVARNRGGGTGGFLLANGRGAQIDPASALAREPFIVVAELTGTAAQGRILLAAPISLAEIEQRFADEIESRDEVTVRCGERILARAQGAQARRHRTCPNRSLR